MDSIRDDALDTRRLHKGGAAVLSLLLTVALTMFAAVFTAPAHADTRTLDNVVAYQGAVPSSVATPLALANAALAKAKLQAANRWVVKASNSLETVRVNIRRAHTAAMNLIGKPPTDPESDDPPGPPAVMAVLRLERVVVLGVVPLYNARKSTTFVQALGYTLYVTQTTRDKMLTRVAGLSPEGAGADFADDMADTVGGYTTEVTLISAALAQYTLVPSGREGLVKALARAQTTRDKVTKAFGGGE